MCLVHSVLSSSENDTKRSPEREWRSRRQRSKVHTLVLAAAFLFDLMSPPQGGGNTHLDLLHRGRDLISDSREIKTIPLHPPGGGGSKTFYWVCTVQKSVPCRLAHRERPRCNKRPSQDHKSAPRWPIKSVLILCSGKGSSSFHVDNWMQWNLIVYCDALLRYSVLVLI